MTEQVRDIGRDKETIYKSKNELVNSRLFLKDFTIEPYLKNLPQPFLPSAERQFNNDDLHLRLYFFALNFSYTSFNPKHSIASIPNQINDCSILKPPRTTQFNL